MWKSPDRLLRHWGNQRRGMCKWPTCLEELDLLPESCRYTQAFKKILSAISYNYKKSSLGVNWGVVIYTSLTIFVGRLHYPVQTIVFLSFFLSFSSFSLFLYLSFSLPAPPPLLPPVWSELNQNRLLVNGSLVELWLVSECKQPPCCCLFSTGLMQCSLDYSGCFSICLCLCFPFHHFNSSFYLLSLCHFIFVSNCISNVHFHLFLYFNH